MKQSIVLILLMTLHIGKAQSTMTSAKDNDPKAEQIMTN